MLCDELKRLNGFGNFDKFGGYYDADKVDTAIAELKARIQLDDDEMAGFLDLEEECGGGDLRNYIAELKDKCQMHDFFWEGCGFEKRGFKNTIAVSEAFDRLEAENAELKQKLEDVQASHYAEMVDAGMRERRLRRSLWLARAERAMAEVYSVLNDVPTSNRWIKARDRLETKAEEYK